MRPRASGASEPQHVARKRPGVGSFGFGGCWAKGLGLGTSGLEAFGLRVWGLGLRV